MEHGQTRETSSKMDTVVQDTDLHQTLLDVDDLAVVKPFLHALREILRTNRGLCA